VLRGLVRCNEESREWPRIHGVGEWSVAGSCGLDLSHKQITKPSREVELAVVGGRLGALRGKARCRGQGARTRLAGSAAEGG